MKQESRVIREISQLGLRPAAEKLAYRLANEIEMPVAFITNSELDKNYFGRHSPVMPNSFFGNIKPQTEQQEFERLVLAFLYHGIQERKRYLRILPKDDYAKTLTGDHKKTYFEMIAHLNSFVLSLETEFFLRGHGITTSDNVHHAMLDDRIQKLREYIQIRKRTPRFRWHREVEVGNLIDYGNYCRRGKAYRDKLLPVVKQVDPKYLIPIQKVADAITNASQRYSAEKAEEIVDWILREIVKLFRLDSVVTLDHTLAFVNTFPISDQTEVPVFSFIPVDYKRQDILVKGVRYANSFLALVKEMCGFHMPTALVYLIDHNSSNAYANPGEAGEYMIAFTTTFFYQLHDLVYNDLPQTEGFKKAEASGEAADYLDKFFHYIVFFITAHEYSHILNGDCSPNQTDPATREKAADEKAEQLLLTCFPAQYRPKEQAVKPPASVGGNIEAFLDWFANLPQEQQLNYAQDACAFRVKIEKDRLILKEAIRFAKGFLRDVAP